MMKLTKKRIELIHYAMDKASDKVLLLSIFITGTTKLKGFSPVEMALFMNAFALALIIKTRFLLFGIGPAGPGKNKSGLKKEKADEI